VERIMYRPPIRPDERELLWDFRDANGERVSRLFEPAPPPGTLAPMIIDPFEPSKPQVSSASVDVIPPSNLDDPTLISGFTERIVGQIITKPKRTVGVQVVGVFLLILVIRRKK
jgi:hypothetical protein